MTPKRFVPIVLDEEQARAASNACAAIFVQLSEICLVGPEDPVFQAAIIIEDALVKAKVIDPLARHVREGVV